MKKLGFGLMRLPVINGDMEQVDIKQLCQMVDLFMEKGFSYFDTSYLYHNGKSEMAIRKALVERYARDKFILATKLPSFAITEPEKVSAIFEEELERCGVDYFDVYLLHNVNRVTNAGQIKDCGMFEFLKKMKEAGKIKKIGFSYHDSAEALDEILKEHPEVDVVQIALNYYDWDSEMIQSRLCYETIRRHGKEVIVMEPVKGGMLATVPDRAKALMEEADSSLSISSWAVRFGASFDGVLSVLSGMSNMEQVKDNTTYMENFVPLTDTEKKILSKVVDIIKEVKAINCTQCGKCDEICPKQVHISDIIATYNSIMCQPMPVFNAELNYYKNLKAKGHAFDACNSCGKCKGICPEGLDVLAELKKAADFQIEHGF